MLTWLQTCVPPGVVSWLCAGLVMLAPATASAQSTASIGGIVRDPSGAVVAGARLALIGVDAGVHLEVVAAGDGGYEFPAVPTAVVLEVEATAGGFLPARSTVPPIGTGERRQVDLILALPGVAEAVSVQADTASPSRTSSPALGGRVDRQQLDRLPINGRDLLAAAYLVPGAAPARGFYNLAPRLTINGASSLTANYTVDGFDNTDLFLGGPKLPVTLGSAEDVQVRVNAYAPEYGRTGNGVLSVTTRSGGNRQRGDAFYMVRPGAVVDAPNYFAPRDSEGRVIDDSFRRQQAGGSLGGALVPDRLFYFGDLEVTRERQDAILTSPLAAGLAPTAFRSQTGMGKVDIRWNDAQRSTVRAHLSDYTHDGDAGFIGGLTLPSAGLTVSYHNQFGSFTHQSTAGAGVNEFGLQVGQLRANWASPDGGPRVLVTDRGATLATIGGVSDDFFWTETDLQVRDVYTRQAGRHTIRAGVDLLRGDFTIRSGPGARGAYVVDLDGRTVRPAGSFLTLADLPRDIRVLSYSQGFVNPVVSSTQTLGAAFAEDQVRVGSDLNLTVGVRWDYDSVTHTPVGRGDVDNVAPRLGLSWTPRGSARHQLRGGYGVFYERIPFAVYSDTLFNNPDTGAISVTFAPGTPFVPPAFPSQLPRDAYQGVPLSQLPPRNVQVFDPNLQSPSTAQASAGYVLTAPGGVAVSVDFVHARGRHLIRRIDTNAPASLPPGAVRTTADADATRSVVPAAGGLRLIEQDQSSGRSTFDGLYVNARRSLRNGVAVDVAYTLSRIQNDTDDINFRPVDSRRPEAELGPSLNDRRHILAVNGLVRVPGLFDLAPVLFLSSGQPLNVTTGRDDNGDTIFNDRPAGVGRNSERTSGFAQFDLGVSRDVPVRTARLQLRADIFNVFNRINFSGFFNYGASGVRPDENGTLAFQPTAAGPARQLQFSARIRF
ncbi:MAG: TonB-dependent receptor [Vicinamibacterales bacterium]